MLRLSAFFVLFCMVLIAGSLGAVLYLVMGLSGSEATVIALSVLTTLAIYNALTARLRDRSDVSAQIADLSRGTADLARQVAELGRRTGELEVQTQWIADNTHAAAAAKPHAAGPDPIAAEIGELGNLVKHLAETVASHELKFVDLRRSAAAMPVVQTEVDVDGKAAASPGRARSEMIEIVRHAIDGNRVDLYLQPIVTLPQRKVRYYEAFTRLRNDEGNILEPAEFLDAAEAGGLMSKIDLMMLTRSVQVVRRLQLKNREIGLFCNIAASTLNDLDVFVQILQFMDANRALASSLVLEVKQSVLRSMGPLETESVAALRDLGFRFCMDQVSDLRMEPRDLGEGGIRYVKVPAALLFDQGDAPSSDIHAADLSDLLGRSGISLIAERIEDETQVVDLLDYDVRFGQGFLFSPPRPVRQEALRSSAEEARGVAETRDKVAAGGAASH